LPPLLSWPTVALIFKVTEPLSPLAAALWAIQPGEFGKVALPQSVEVLVLFQKPVVSLLAQVEVPVAAWRFTPAASARKPATEKRMRARMDFTNTGFPVCQAGGAGDGAEFWMSSIGVAHKMSQFAMKGNPPLTHGKKTPAGSE